MAIIISGHSKCAICGNIVERTDQIVATSGAFVEPGHFLWSFCDAGMHRDCFQSWPFRQLFTSLYFKSRRESLLRNPYWHVVFVTEDAVAAVNPDPPVSAVCVRSASVLGECRIPLSEWEAQTSPPTGLDPDAVRSFADLWPKIRSAVPTVASLLAFVDRRAAEELRIRKKAADELRRSQLDEFNAAAKSAASAAQGVGLPCPHCGARRADHRFCDGSDREARSFFVCASCARSFSHAASNVE